MKNEKRLKTISSRDDEETELYGKLSRAITVIEQYKVFAQITPEVRTNLVYAPIL